LPAILVLFASFSAGVAGAVEINVLCSGAMRAVLQQLAADFENSSGHKLVIEYATAGKVEERVAADEAIDVAILTKPRAEKLERTAKLVGGTTTALARVPIGLP
jgi:molybdate transport system substrate-binding protein